MGEHSVAIKMWRGNFKWGRRTDPLVWRHTKNTVWQVRWFATYAPSTDEPLWRLHLWKTPHPVMRPRTQRPVPKSFRLGDVVTSTGVAPFFAVCPICLYSRTPEGENP